MKLSLAFTAVCFVFGATTTHAQSDASPLKSRGACNIAFKSIDPGTNITGVDRNLASGLYNHGFMPFKVTELSHQQILKNSNLFVGYLVEGAGSPMDGSWCRAEISIHRILPSGVTVQLWMNSFFEESRYKDIFGDCSRAFNRTLSAMPQCSELPSH